MTSREQTILYKYIADILIPNYSDGWLDGSEIADVAIDPLKSLNTMLVKPTELGQAILNNEKVFIQMVEDAVKELEVGND
ncbi:hypothetical protein [Pediococcus pentosaceus]|uniref:hypothetical protein n=1 Tax=Pediococcus pentosaceus TaxID=1255 RepID=UPI002E313D3C|nr:hypothetical protein [Pediococcus pentosaceus]